MAETRQARINAHAAGWNDAPPAPNLPAPYRSGRRGEVVTMPAAEFERLSAVTVNVHYPDPRPGAVGTVARPEPAVVDPDAAVAEVEEAQTMRGRIAELETELATLRAQEPPSGSPVAAGPLAAAAVEVALPPSVTGVRLPAAADVGIVGTTGLEGLAGEPSSAALGTMTAEQAVAYLNQNPERVDDVAAAEAARPRPRVGVMEALQQVREARAETSGTTPTPTP